MASHFSILSDQISIIFIGRVQQMREAPQETIQRRRDLYLRRPQGPALGRQEEGSAVAHGGRGGRGGGQGRGAGGVDGGGVGRAGLQNHQQYDLSLRGDMSEREIGLYFLSATGFVIPIDYWACHAMTIG